ncbi:MAG: hypothetical protein SGJ19_19110 [Planctomycetia bacterium]|nr:hypothetical protein [Planctomycetia bacterium]
MRPLALLMVAAALGGTSIALAANETTTKSLRASTSDEAKGQLFAWLDAQNASPELRLQVETQWAESEASTGDLLERVARAIAIVDERARPLLESSQAAALRAPLPDIAWLQAADVAPFMSNNLRLWYGRSLAQREYYDESSALLTDLEPRNVVDPAALLFYQAVVHQRLLAKDPGLKAIDALLDDVDAAPRRYLKLAALLRTDLAALEDESLEHISRRMENIERHLGLGRTDQKVRDIEDGVIESLDKMIKKLEDQAKQAAQSSGKGGQQSGRAQGIKPGGSPAQQSTPAGGRGAGEVNPRDLGSEDGWGNLPPKEREEALQQIGQDFPAHYRDVIEQYFRKLADEGREN